MPFALLQVTDRLAVFPAGRYNQPIMQGRCKACGALGSLGEACRSAACVEAGWHYICEPLPPDEDPLLGLRLNATWTLVERLGRGGFGSVYRALQAPLQNDVAVKVLHATRAQPENLSRFEREALTLASVRHPNIVAFINTGTQTLPGHAGEVRFLAMEALQHGILLSTVLREASPLDDESIWRIFGGILRGLKAVHQAGIVHRDLKPDNVLLIDGVPKILDFGLARPYGDDSLLDEVTTEAGSFRGTAAYAAPEQAWGGQIPVGPESDVYAVGCMLFEAWCGSRAWTSRPASELLNAKIKNAFEPFSKNAFLKLNESKRELLRAAMHPEPSDRLADGTVFLEQLKQVTLPTLESPARPSPSAEQGVISDSTASLSVQEPVTKPQPEPETPVQTQTPRASSGGMTRPKLVLAVGGLLVVVAVVAWWLMSPTPSEDLEPSAQTPPKVEESTTPPQTNVDDMSSVQAPDARAPELSTPKNTTHSVFDTPIPSGTPPPALPPRVFPDNPQPIFARHIALGNNTSYALMSDGSVRA